MGLVPFLRRNKTENIFSGDIPERELIEKCRSGSHEAFEDIYRKYSGLVFSIAFGVLKNHHGASETTQEVFITVYRRLDSFRGSGSFKAWISRIALNNSLAVIRKKTESVPLDNMEELPHADGVPDKVTGMNELNDRFSEALSGMPDELREAFSLAVLAGTPYQEAAETIGISLELVKVRVFRARKFLKEKLKKYIEEG